ncbi:MAG: SPOR domain-containing protein [Burkholderiales bacterium]|nr:SPOR domain-containing protein [Burkholderiales bacterium]
MRALFFFLVLVNLAFLAWNLGYLGEANTGGREGSRLAAQIDPDKIRILNAAEASRHAAGKGASATSVASTVACLEWGSFPAQEVERVQAVLAALKPPPKFSLRRVDETAGWWVYLPPQANKPAADKRLAELKQLGIAEFFVINDDGPNKFAISLGVFKTEEAARNYLDSLARKGVRTARTAERETRVAKTMIVFREVDEATRGRLNEARKDFAGVELRECAGEDRRGEARSG